MNILYTLLRHESRDKNNTTPSSCHALSWRNMLTRRKKTLVVKCMFLVGICWILTLIYETNYSFEKDNPVEEKLVNPLSDLENIVKFDENEPVIKGENANAFEDFQDVKEEIHNDEEVVHEKLEEVLEKKDVEEPAPEEVAPPKQDEHVIEAPHDPNGPGEMGKAVKLENLDPETKKLVDKGWQDNAFNQYVSDLISLDRTLPDHRLVTIFILFKRIIQIIKKKGSITFFPDSMHYVLLIYPVFCILDFMYSVSLIQCILYS